MSSPVQTNREPIPRDLELFRDLGRRFSIEIDAFDEFRIVPMETRKKTVKTGAGDSL